MKKGDVLAVMENVASTDDILRLKEYLTDWQAKGTRPERLETVFFHRLPRLGSVQGAYASCLWAWNNYLLHIGGNRIHETELNNAVAQLITAICEWEKIYLPVAPITGQVAFMQLRKAYILNQTRYRRFYFYTFTSTGFGGYEPLP